GPRKTPILAGRLEGTAPYSWLGEHATLKDHIRHTIKTRLHGKGLNDRELADLELYLTHLPPPPPPAASGERLPRARDLFGAAAGERIARGRDLFGSDEVGCTHCHRADRHFSDGVVHDVGSISEEEVAKLTTSAVEKAKSAQQRQQQKGEAELEKLGLRLVE